MDVLDPLRSLLLDAQLPIAAAVASWLFAQLQRLAVVRQLGDWTKRLALALAAGVVLLGVRLLGGAPHPDLLTGLGLLTLGGTAAAVPAALAFRLGRASGTTNFTKGTSMGPTIDRVARVYAIALLLLCLVAPATLTAQAIAPCLAITGADSTRADRCVPVPPVVTPPVDPAPSDSFAHAYGRWSPSQPGDCTQAQHDSYRVKVDGKWYPTWHPPTGPGGCTFGHEHGKDPSGSHLATMGPIAFGLANEKLHEQTGQPVTRHEDHVGHKIEWGNDVAFTGATPRTCDVFVRLHQGGHSPDAFVNNLHEMDYRLACSTGERAHVTTLVNIGSYGRMLDGCTSAVVETGPAVPPDGYPNHFGGSRSIPTRGCIDQHIATSPRTWVSYARLTENWAIDPSVTLASGRRVAVFAVYAFLGNPARYYDASAMHGLRRTVDVCWEVDDPRDGRTMGECAQVRRDGVRSWLDPRSPFKGTQRTIRWNQPVIANAGGPEVIWTDAFGRQGQATPFPGAIRQLVSPVDNGGLQVTGPGLGGDYNAPGVRGQN